MFYLKFSWEYIIQLFLVEVTSVKRNKPSSISISTANVLCICLKFLNGLKFLSAASESCFFGDKEKKWALFSKLFFFYKFLLKYLARGTTINLNILPILDSPIIITLYSMSKCLFISIQSLLNNFQRIIFNLWFYSKKLIYFYIENTNVTCFRVSRHYSKRDGVGDERHFYKFVSILILIPILSKILKRIDTKFYLLKNIKMPKDTSV
jgi:hypothetical protein